ncbi:MAG: glycerophosphodiester phosphodiesterase [Coprococcus sp.]
MNNNTYKKLGIQVWKNKYRLLLVQMVFGFLAAYISIPVITKGFYLVIKLSGYSAITRENYLKILKTPGACIYAAVILLLCMLMTLFNVVMVVVLLDRNCRNSRKNVWDYIKQVEKHFARYIFSKKILSLYYFIPFIVAVYMPAIILMFYNNSVLSFLTHYVHVKIGSVLQWTIILVIYLLSIVFTVFRFPVMRWLILSDRSYKRVLRGAKPEIRLSLKRLKTYLVWVLGVCLLSVLLYLALICICIFVVKLMSHDNNMLIIFYEVYGNINIIIMMLIALICGLLNFGAIAELTKAYIPGYQNPQPELKKNSRIALATAFVLISVVAMFFCIQFMLGGKDMTYVSLGKTLVSAHRGASTEAPENTIPAIQKAIDNEADYVEIDVRLTADGQVVLMHDASTKRTTDGKMKVEDSTYEELLTLDAGSWFSEEYKETRIPTLEEVIKLCKGRIMMNIELKPADSSGALEEAVAKLITEYNMESQCIVTSFNQRSLLKMKSMNKGIVTGYIYTFGYSNNIEYKGIDVLSISSKYLTRDVVAGAHRKGIIVAAWTVNTSSEMRRMVAIGVDNIITDNIPLAKKTIYKKSENELKDVWKYIASIYTN